MKIGFVHPDLGIGGAERLVVDAAIALQNRGHKVVLYTSHHDRSHCFKETRDGSLKVICRADIPHPKFIRGFHLLTAILRNVLLCMSIVRDWYLRRDQKYDVFFVDQLSVSIPILKLTGAKVFFYCHYPDKLLSNTNWFLKYLYRLPLDWLEEITSKQADKIVANSKFTSQVFSDSFKSIYLSPEVVYPCLNLDAYDVPVDDTDPQLRPIMSHKQKILSINRFERKKHVELAIESFAKLRDMLDADLFGSLQLVIAGGYDLRVRENVQYHKFLQNLAEESNLSNLTVSNRDSVSCAKVRDVSVVFILSFTENQRRYLLQSCSGVVYTPSNEHFGIVPLEAMYSRRPVIAVCNGGPAETVQPGKTGWLCEPSVSSFSNAMKELVTMNKAEIKRMGQQSREFVENGFSLDSFGEKLETMLENIIMESPQEASMPISASIFVPIISIFVVWILIDWVRKQTLL